MRRICLSFLVAIVLAGSFAVPTSRALGPLTISYIDVGQGDAILIRDPHGFDILIDGGTKTGGTAVVNYLREHSVDDVDVMIATHADADHIGGLISVLNMPDVPVRQVIYSGYSKTSKTWTDFVNAVDAEGLSLTAAQYPQTYEWGEIDAAILNPRSDLIEPETNAACVVVSLTYGSHKFLFTCDISEVEESEIIDRGCDVSANILKVAHHGSKYGSSTSFVNTVGMSEAIISVGQNNYGHPAPETLSRLTSAGAAIYRTDWNGTVVVTSDGFSYTVTPSKIMLDYMLYLPLIIKDETTPTPQPTEPVPTEPVPTEPVPTEPVPTEPPPDPATTGNVVITSIFADGSDKQEPDEYVQIENKDTRAIQLAGWTLKDIADHVYQFPSFVMEPGKVCRVYTNENHPEWCGFNYGSGSAIWNNTGDTAYLRDGSGTLISQYTYP